MATDKPLNVSSITRTIHAQTPIILDGALATYLETLGADISGSLWSADILIKNPSLIRQAHLDYYRAGAQVAITASYQASLPGLLQYLGTSEDEVKEVVKTSVRLAQEARDEYVSEIIAATSDDEMAEMINRGGSTEGYRDTVKAGLWVAGSVGPYGAFLANGAEYRGDYSLPKGEMKDFHRGRIAALVESGADILAIETIPSKEETEALVDLLRTEFQGTKAWFTFTLSGDDAIADGTALSTLVPLFEGVEQVLALGFNCVSDDLALAAVKRLRPLVKQNVGIVIYPNSGEQWNAQAREWEGQRTEGGLLGQKTKEWFKAGARLIGGCCRTTPEDIRVMRETLGGLNL
ncbi:homocysteine S-methyltransferas-like protein [Plenodomus tracheiphilus IPT5]|uniref:Homocysteine S-methyltransferas-like protein n=1 Tax=Plenodomus tracheiphilus IPT5 TaxID=1408161 RepID=A0A6A7B279_9PLEO|nr:homocysteine S-methyltransferas-like protein [Plenodomus tracheiphilus IPT5]